ncbi:33 kDa inner dynein arm light chain [Diplonema papillatum]|nr:33 kDa inner dynein arm light chain [Diplonema papillatum]
MGEHPPPDSLVAYENPALLSSASKRNPPKNALRAATEAALNTIVPPRQWKEDGIEWVQYVSSTPATPMDVVNLQEALDRKLQQLSAREVGTCPVREELYAQAFDELIREVTVTCAERGLLLLRVRDEIRMNISSYKKLYESSIAFGMRKALQAEQLRADTGTEIGDLETSNGDLEAKVEEYTQRCAVIEQQEIQRRKEDLEKHQAEVELLKKANSKLTVSLQGLLGISKK